MSGRAVNAEMRAGQVKENLEALETLARAADVRAAMAPADLALIDDVSRLAWLPVRVDVALTEAVARVCGVEAMRQWSQVSIRRSFAKPLLQPLIAGAMQVFGLSPSAFYRVVARGWSNVYRGCGELTVVDVTSDGCGILWQGVPVEVTPNYLEGVAATLLAILEVTQVKGAVAIEREGSACRFVVTWTNASKRDLERKR